MNSAQCIAKVLQRIVENIDSIKEGANIVPLINSVSKIGSYVLKKSLPCSLLKDTILIVNQYQPYCKSPLASTFLNEVYQFYKTENLCTDFKLAILSCFKPAVETEVLALLNMCLGVNHLEELDLVKAAVSKSCLPLACAENAATLHKVDCTFKKCMIITNGNPVVGYLSFIFNKAVQNCSKSFNSISLLPKKLFHLEILFCIPQEVFCQQQHLIYTKQLISSLIESVNDSLCDRNDIIFHSALYPALYYQILTLHKNKAFDAYKFLQIFYDIGSTSAYSYFKIDLDSILKNPVWKYLLENY